MNQRHVILVSCSLLLCAGVAFSIPGHCGQKDGGYVAEVCEAQTAFSITCTGPCSEAPAQEFNCYNGKKTPAHLKPCIGGAASQCCLDSLLTTYNCLCICAPCAGYPGRRMPDNCGGSCTPGSDITEGNLFACVTDNPTGFDVCD